MKIRPSILWLCIALIIVTALIIWLENRPAKLSPQSEGANPATSSIEHIVTKSNTIVGKSISTEATSATPNSQTNLIAFPQSNKIELLRQILQANDANIVFYGRLEDQFGNAVFNAVVNFSVRYENASSNGVRRGQVVSDGNGFFTISGYQGQDLSVVPKKAGYALASLDGGGIYSPESPEAQRAHPDPNNPVVIKMWKLQGIEPLVGIDQHYKLRYTGAPINFDLLSGKIVPSGGDIKITINRPPGIISGRNRQDWGFAIEAIGGGLMETSIRESQITYAAPEDGYQQSDTLMASANQHGIELIQQMFFVQSRNGQVYSKLFISFDINSTPEGLMSISFRGVANANSSRNFEGDPNTLKAAGEQ